MVKHASEETISETVQCHMFNMSEYTSKSFHPVYLFYKVMMGVENLVLQKLKVNSIFGTDFMLSCNLDQSESLKCDCFKNSSELNQ